MVMIFDHATYKGNFSGIFDAGHFHHLHVDLGMEILIHIKNISDASRHASSEVAACSAQNDYATTSHIFASMIANAFDDCIGARISYSKPFGCDTPEVALTAGSSIQTHISDQDVLFR